MAPGSVLTIELPGAVTPGHYDMRKYVDEYRLPDLDGREILERLYHFVDTPGGRSENVAECIKRIDRCRRDRSP